MNFFYFLVVFVVFSSTCNCEVIKSAADVKSNSSAHHPSVPWQIRFATMSVANLLLSATIWLTNRAHCEEDMYTLTFLGCVVFTGIFTVGYIFLGWSISYQQAILSYSSLPGESVFLRTVQQQWDFCNLIGFAIVVRLCPSGMNIDTQNLPTWFFFLHYAFNLFSPILIVFGVYLQLISAFIPMGFLLVISYVGAALIESQAGQFLSHTATVNLMLFVDVQLLTTLSSALNDGKFSWTLTLTLIKAILMIFAIRSVSNEFIGRWTGSQRVLETYMFPQLQLALQLSLSCLLCYFICLIYSFSAQ